MPQSLASLHSHIIFSTKNRIPDLKLEWQPRLHAYLGGILRSHGGKLLAAGGMPDHIHLLVSMSRDTSVSEIVRLLKSNSSGWIHATFPDRKGFAWQTGYAAFAVSYSHLAAVKHYILAQEKHHRKKSFQEELLAFLKRHDLKFDERYLWD